MISLQPMTLYELLSLIISIAGFAILIITLVFLTRQTREMATQTRHVGDSLKGNAYGSVASQMFAVDRVFINEPELRPYFYSGRDISNDDPLYDKVVAVAELLLDFFDSVLLQQKHFPQIWPRQWWEAYMMYSFANSPLLCGYLESVKDWYTEDLVHLMRKGEAQRQRANAQSG